MSDEEILDMILREVSEGIRQDEVLGHFNLEVKPNFLETVREIKGKREELNYERSS